MKLKEAATIENALEKLFIDELASMHSAEKQLVTALAVLARIAQSEDLKQLLEMHQKDTKGHVHVIEGIAESLEVKLPKKRCDAMTGLIEEGVLEVVKNLKSSVLDTALIAAGHKIEHYEIASYGTLCRWAKELGHAHEFTMLFSILNQEKLADALLGELSEGIGPLTEAVRQASQNQIKAAVIAS